MSRLAALQPTRLLAALRGSTVRAQADDATTGGINETITVPDVRPGLYDVCVQSSGNETACGTFRVTAKTVVGGVSFSRGGDEGIGTRVLGRVFARTGVGIVTLLLLGVSLVLLGRYILGKTRPRRV